MGRQFSTQGFDEKRKKKKINRKQHPRIHFDHTRRTNKIKNKNKREKEFRDVFVRFNYQELVANR